MRGDEGHIIKRGETDVGPTRKSFSNLQKRQCPVVLLHFRADMARRWGESGMLVARRVKRSSKGPKRIEDVGPASEYGLAPHVMARLGQERPNSRDCLVVNNDVGPRP